ncbi:MAG: hypothetical protein ABIS38_00360 [Sphingomicrobium sp.]
MIKSSHCVRRLSILAGALVALTGAGQAAAGNANVYAGRWTVSEDKPVFSRRGLDYKSFDIAQCGRDYCGVSVGRSGRCGPTLFRFKAKTVSRQRGLVGHGRWGDAVKNVETYAWPEKGARGGRGMNLNLGDGHDFGERSGSMPKFSAEYSPVGAARCIAR